MYEKIKCIYFIKFNFKSQSFLKHRGHLACKEQGRLQSVDKTNLNKCVHSDCSTRPTVLNQYSPCGLQGFSVPKLSCSYVLEKTENNNRCLKSHSSFTGIVSSNSKHGNLISPK